MVASVKSVIPPVPRCFVNARAIDTVNCAKNKIKPVKQRGIVKTVGAARRRINVTVAKAKGFLANNVKFSRRTAVKHSVLIAVVHATRDIIIINLP